MNIKVVEFSSVIHLGFVLNPTLDSSDMDFSAIDLSSTHLDLLDIVTKSFLVNILLVLKMS